MAHSAKIIAIRPPNRQLIQFTLCTFHITGFLIAFFLSLSSFYIWY